MLEGLDLVPWERLDGAGVTDEDVPGLLRTIGTAIDEQIALDALGELRWEILHQGTVYSSTAPAARFLGEMLAGVDGTRRGYVADLLGDLAHSCELDPSDPMRVGVRAEVTAQVDRILPLLDDAEAWTRFAAAYALGGCPARAADIGPALRHRWSVEADARVRAGLVMAVAALEPRTDLVNEALGTAQPPAVRAGAVLAIVRSGRRWPGKRAAAAVREAWRHGDPFAGPEGSEEAWRPKAFYEGALEELLERLDAADRPPIVAALLGSPDPQVRARAAMQASSAMGEYRSVRRPLTDVLVRSLTDAEPLVRLAAADAIRRAGPAAAHAADALAAVVEGHDDEAAGQALAALVELGDPRAARHLPARIRAGTAADDIGAALVMVGTTADAELLGAVRHRISEMATGTPADRQIDIIRSMPGRSHYVDSERTTLLMLVQSWGPAAASAAADLAGLLPAVPTAERVAAALAAIGPDAAPALPALRAHAETIRDEPRRDAERVAVARACWRISGDPEQAIDEAWQHITGGGAGTRAAELLAEIGDPARRLLPEIRRALPGWLDRSEWYQSERLVVARLIWQWTGDAEPALSMAKVFLGVDIGDVVAYGQFEAAILAVELGDATAAAALTGIASADNGSYAQRVRACRTLWRLTGDAGPALPALLEAMTTADYPPTKDSWTALLELLTELGSAAEPLRPALGRLAERDESVAAASAAESPGLVDEQIRAAIQAVGR